MRFLAKVEAIHPRGYKAKSGVTKTGTNPKGKTLKDHLDWISSSVMELISDFNFSPKTNKLIHEVRSLHDFVTDSMNTEQKLAAYTKLADMTAQLGKEIQRLYAKGALPENVDRKMVHAFLDGIAGVEKRKHQLAEAKHLLELSKNKLESLGF
jgi:hypothetical protein